MHDFFSNLDVMASTRNKNTRGNYCLEQQSNRHFGQWATCPALLPDDKPVMGGNGLLSGPSPAFVLSENMPDILSFLWGTGSTDLTTPVKPCLVPEINCLKQINLYETPPVYMPDPLVVEANQRPLLYGRRA